METWDLMHHWHLVLPPSRPSANQLDWIRAAIAEVERDRPVAVLGSTPEFRDLLSECGFTRIYVLEKNVSFYEAMSNARIYRNPETVVTGDWLDTLPSVKQTFGVILSDLTSGNIEYEQRARFYDGIAASLARAGLFLDKVLTHGRDLLTVEGLIDKYSHLPLNLLYVNHFSSEMLFCSELLRPGQVVDSSRFYSDLNDLVRHDRVRAFVEQAKYITPPGCVWWYGREWSELDREYGAGMVRQAITEDETDGPYRGRVKYFQLLKT